MLTIETLKVAKNWTTCEQYTSSYRNNIFLWCLQNFVRSFWINFAQGQTICSSDLYKFVFMQMFLFTNNCYYRKKLNRVQRKTTFILNTISEADELIYTVCIYTICMYLYRKLSTEIHNSTSYQKIRKLL